MLPPRTPRVMPCLPWQTEAQSNPGDWRSDTPLANALLIKSPRAVISVEENPNVVDMDPAIPAESVKEKFFAVVTATDSRRLTVSGTPLANALLIESPRAVVSVWGNPNVVDMDSTIPAESPKEQFFPVVTATDSRRPTVSETPWARARMIESPTLVVSVRVNPNAAAITSVKLAMSDTEVTNASAGWASLLSASPPAVSSYLKVTVCLPLV